MYKLYLEHSKKIVHDSRDVYTDLCRFAAAFVMLFHHSELLGGNRIAKGGWIFVEFFFILSGYYTTKHFAKKPLSDGQIEKKAVLYVIKKLKRIVPYAILGIVIDILVMFGKGDLILDDLSMVITELPAHLGLMVGFDVLQYSFNAPLWYLSCLLVTMPLMIILMQKNNNIYRYYLCWACPIVIYCFMISINGSIQYWGSYWAINCLFRAVAGLFLGSFVYYVSSAINEKGTNDRISGYLKIFEVLLFVHIIVLSFTTDCINIAFSCVCVLLISLILSFSESCNIGKYMPSRISYLGQLSTPMYCIHSPVFKLIAWIFKDYSFDIRLFYGVVFCDLNLFDCYVCL